MYVRYELAWCDEYEYGDSNCDDVDDYDGCYVDFDGYACYVICFGFEFDDVQVFLQYEHSDCDDVSPDDPSCENERGET